MRLIVLCIAVLTAFCCNGQQCGFIPFAHNKLTCDSNGVPKDSLTYYFPFEYFYDSIHYANYIDPELKLEMRRMIGDCCSSLESLSKELHIPMSSFWYSDEKKIDTFKESWYSYELYKMNEPVLYNYFLGKETYRFTWLRSFDLSVVIKLEKIGDEIFITTKEFNKMIELPFYKELDSQGHEIVRNFNVEFAQNNTVRKKNIAYNKLIHILKQKNFYNNPHLPYRPCSIGTDGSEWIFEAHTKDGYYFMNRWTPSEGSDLRAVGEYLISLSSLGKERMY